MHVITWGIIPVNVFSNSMRTLKMISFMSQISSLRMFPGIAPTFISNNLLVISQGILYSCSNTAAINSSNDPIRLFLNIFFHQFLLKGLHENLHKYLLAQSYSATASSMCISSICIENPYRIATRYSTKFWMLSTIIPCIVSYAIYVGIFG